MFVLYPVAGRRMSDRGNPILQGTRLRGCPSSSRPHSRTATFLGHRSLNILPTISLARTAHISKGALGNQPRQSARFSPYYLDYVTRIMMTPTLRDREAFQSRIFTAMFPKNP
jgi:hypothetical protein